MTNKNTASKWRVLLARIGYETRNLFNQIQPTTQSGMGALPNGDHIAFRVWAPHADKVFVSGSFNQWSPWRSPLASEGNGYWSGNIPQATSGDSYKYLLHHQTHTQLRTDPYVIDVEGAERNGVIAVIKSVPTDDFQMPPINELVIYELHVGTFSNSENHVVGTFAGV